MVEVHVSGGLAEGALQIIRRVEFLCHDINVHVPHHVNSKIPWYNLRAATDSLRSNWGEVRRARSLLCHPQTHGAHCTGRWCMLLLTVCHYADKVILHCTVSLLLPWEADV